MILLYITLIIMFIIIISLAYINNKLIKLLTGYSLLLEIEKDLNSIKENKFKIKEQQLLSKIDNLKHNKK